MKIDVSLELVSSRKLAAVRRQVLSGGVALAWRPALDLVWAFLREHPGLRDEGHNVFVYHHPAVPGGPMEVDFGVEISGSFAPSGEVHESTTPSGEAAVGVHHGAYGELHRAHKAIEEWAKLNGRRFGGVSWEIYGDWSDDPSKLETIVMYLLA